MKKVSLEYLSVIMIYLNIFYAGTQDLKETVVRIKFLRKDSEVES